MSSNYKTAKERAKEILALLPDYPWSVTLLPRREGALEVGLLVDSHGRVALAPQPESSAMLTAEPGVLQAVAELPTLLEELLWLASKADNDLQS